MDKFDMNLFNFFHKQWGIKDMLVDNKKLSFNVFPEKTVNLSIWILDFVVKSLGIIYSKGDCFTDIKQEQIVIRKSRGRGRYKTVKYEEDEYELAVIDLDYNKCNRADKYMYTFAPPLDNLRFRKNGRIKLNIEGVTMWSFGIFILRLFCSDLFRSKDQKEALSYGTRHLYTIVNNFNKQAFIPQYIKDLVNICIKNVNEKSKWKDVEKIYKRKNL